MMRRHTIHDVATDAKVAVSTVSYVFSGRRKISLDVRRRVMSSVARLNYRPNATARSLVMRRTMQVGVLVDERAWNVRTIKRELQKHGYRILLGLCEGDHRKEALEHLADFAHGMVDGIINMIPAISAAEMERVCNGIPSTTYCRPRGLKGDLIDLDATYQPVFEYLWGLGHRRIGVFSIKQNCPDLPAIDRREVAYRHFMKAKGVPVDRRMIVRLGWDVEDGRPVADQLYRAGATAIVVSSDAIATGVIQWAYANGVRIPQDLSLVGFNDGPEAKITTPNLTTLRLPLEALAEITVASLLACMEGDAPPRYDARLVPALVVRGSTGPAPLPRGATQTSIH